MDILEERVGSRTAGWCRDIRRFDGFTLDISRGALLGPDGAERPLRPKAYALLKLLVENAGRLMDRDRIMCAVWPGVVVTDDSIAQAVSELRRVLGADGGHLLRTVPRRGFLFASEVSCLDPVPDASGPVGPVAKVPAAGPPTLVVLPFSNMTGDPTQDYFADGITEDLTAALSRLRWFAVISRSSAFIYKGRAVDVREVGRELGVGYVLEGSIRRAGGRVRINAQLCEAESGHHVWAERFDGDLADVFDLQDRVTEAVVGAIEPSLRGAEVKRIRARPTESLSAYDLYLRALPHRYTTRECSDEALGLLRRAVTLDPSFTNAKGALAGLHIVRFTQGWTAPGDVEEALRHAREVVEGDGNDPGALAWSAHALSYLGKDYDAGVEASDRALCLAPNSAQVLFLCGWNRLYAGDWQVAVAQIERAMGLSPKDPGMFYFTASLGAANFFGEQYEAVVSWSRRAIRERSDYLVAHRLLVSSLAQLGRVEEAREALGALLIVAPGYTVGAANAHAASRGQTRERFLGGLRSAGLPE